MSTKLLSCSAVLASSLLLSACGGSSGGATAVTPSTEVNGTVFASEISGASVVIEDGSGNPIAGPVTTNAQGQFSISLPLAQLSNNLIVRATGGQYADEATQQTTSNDSLSAYIAAGTLLVNTDFSLTPSTTIIEQLVTEHGQSITNALLTFQDSFGFLPDLGIIPANITQAQSGKTNEELLAGLRAATFSQLTQDLGLPPAKQGELLRKLAEDIADGSFDGMVDGTTEIEIDHESTSYGLGAHIKNRFAQALLNFRNGSWDYSGLNNASIGFMPFALTAQSDEYRVQYVANNSPIRAGKASVSFQVTDLQGNAVTGLTPEFAPIMYMANHNHATPFSEVVEDSETDGLYHGTVYYLMPSMMANGNAMGLWRLNIDLDSQNRVSFFPRVNMLMGETTRSVLRSQSDFSPLMGGEQEKRAYMIFKHSLASGNSGHDLSVFIAAKESMMNFPTETGLTLNAGSGYAQTINTVQVEFSTNGTNWDIASSQGAGIWSLNNISGLSNEASQSVYVRLTIDGEVATTDGSSTGTAYAEATGNTLSETLEIQ